MDLSSFDYGTIIAIASLVVAVIGLFLQQHKTKADLELSKRGIEILSRLVESYQTGQESQRWTEQQKLDLERWKAIAKAAGWVLDRIESEED
jgi:hypothetical protein